MAINSTSVDNINCDENYIYVNMIYSDSPKKTYTFPNKLEIKQYNNIIKLDKDLNPIWVYGVDLKPTFLYSIINIPGKIMVNNGSITFLSIREPNSAPARYQFDFWVTVLQDFSDYSKECINEAILYPNPAVSGATVTMQLNTKYNKAITIRLFDSVGRFLDSKNINVQGDNITYALPNDLSSGFYFLQLQCDGQNIVKKIFVL